jgi:hypothetical protein
MSKKITKITKLTVYWDTQDPDNEGWAWRTDDDSGEIAIVSHASLDEAIDQACHELDIDANHDDFDKSTDEGGYGFWGAD